MHGERFESGSACLGGRNLGWVVTSLGLGIAALAFLGLAALTRTVELVVPAVSFGILGAALGASVWWSNPDRRLLPGAVSVVDGALLRDGKPVLARGEVKQGFVVPDKSGRTWVRLDKRRPLSPASWVAVADVEEGRALLRALGLDASQTVAELRALPPWATLGAGQQALRVLPFIFGWPILAVTAGAIGGSVGPALIAAVVGALLLASVFGIHKQRVRVGADGLAIGWLGRERFVPFKDVLEVRQLKHTTGGKTALGVELALRDGGVTRLAAGQEGYDEDAAAVLLERVREAFEQHRLRSGGASVEALARGERSAVDWIRDLRRRGAGGAVDARTAPIAPEALVRVAEDPAQAPLARVGAAVALAAAGDASLTDRVRVAASTTTAAPLRVALERAIADDDAALEEAIQALEREAGEAATKR